MPLIAGGILMGTGMIGGGLAGGKQADAMESAAQAQKGMAEKALQFQMETQAKALDLAKMTPEQIGQMNKMFAMQDMALQKNLSYIAKEEELLNAVNPALKEAGVQALQMLQGKEAAVLKPIRDDIARQRGYLENKLREQLGEGYATSSAGIEALNRFDQQANSVLASAQDQSMGRLLQTSANVKPNMIGLTNAGITGAANIGLGAAQLQQNNQQMQINALTGTMPNFGPSIATAGAPFVGDIQKYQNLNQLFGSMAGVGGALFGASAGGGGGGGFNAQQFMMAQQMQNAVNSGQKTSQMGGNPYGYNYMQG